MVKPIWRIDFSAESLAGSVRNHCMYVSEIETELVLVADILKNGVISGLI